MATSILLSIYTQRLIEMLPEGSHGEAPQLVLYSYLWQFGKQIAVLILGGLLVFSMITFTEFIVLL